MGPAINSPIPDDSKPLCGQMKTVLLTGTRPRSGPSQIFKRSFRRAARRLFLTLPFLLAGAVFATATAPDQQLPRVFHEPLLALGGAPTPEETSQLQNALLGFATSKRNGQPDWSTLTTFLTTHPHSAWNASLLLNLGEEYYDNGYFSRALDAWSKSWGVGKSATTTDGQAIANRALAQWARMLCRVGRLREVRSVLAQAGGRSFQGSTARMMDSARHSLWMMENHPELTYRCGPHALERILLYTKPQQSIPTELVHSVSGVNGIPMTDVAAMAHRVGLDYQMARRTGTAAIPLPAVAHWKLDHYAAVLKFEAGRYLMDDPTFGNGLLWVTPDALDSESDGYFLIPSGPLPAGWTRVDQKEGSQVWGRGYPGGFPPPPPPPPPPDPPDNGDPPEDGGDDPEVDSDPGDPIDIFNLCSGGMAGWNVQLSMLNLRVFDTPLGYTPPVGPAIYFNVHYNEQASDQPAVFAFGNLGPQWTCDWIASLTFDTANAYYHSGQGGLEQFSGFDPTTQTYQSGTMQPDTLLKLSPTNYVITRPRGSKLVFSLPDNPTAPSRVFLTQIVDPQGNAATLTYDSSFRLTGITDAIGQTTTLSYGGGSSALLIQKVTDPFGRFATFSYDSNGELTNITDVIGLTSAFSYTNGDVQTLTTGYGTTSFLFATNSNNDRFVQVTEPNGEQQRFEEGNGSTPGITFSEPVVPQGILAFNEYLDGRDTYYWDRKALAEAHGLYPAARIYHFMHQDLNTRSPIMESMKMPGQNRIWFNYQGQNSSGFYNYGMYGGQPSKVGMILDNGQTQLSQASYNSLGHITQRVDPVGRTELFIYASNNIDLMQVQRMTGPGQTSQVAAFTWNNAHQPLTVKDAAGQTTTITYNSQGQPLTVTTPKNQTTTFTYNSSNYLTAIQGPLGASDTMTLTYDAYGRVGTITDVGGYMLAYHYDALNRVTNISYPDGTSLQRTYHLLDPATFSDRRGRVTTYTYDSLRQLVQVQDPLGRLTHFEWCGCGSIDGVVDALGRLTQWQHDLAGRPTSTTYPDGSTTTYSYDSAGLVKTVTDANGQTKLFTHALDNLVTSISYPNASVPTPAVQFLYDSWFPRLAERVDGAGATFYSYYPITGGPLLGAGKLRASDGPLPNDTISYSYDELGRVTSQSINGLSQSISYDALGRITTMTNPLGSFSYAYVGASPRVSAIAYPNGQNAAFSYFPNSADRRLQEIWNKLPGGGTLSKFDYTYDADGFITSWTQQHGAGSPNVLTPSYDLDDRLTGAATTSPAQNYAYTYDGADNRLTGSIGAAVVTAGYNALDELVGLSTNVESSRTYQWDAENRLASITYSGTGQNTQFTYDGMGHCVRITEMSGGSVVSDKHLVWSGQSVVEACDATGTASSFFFPQGVQVAAGPQAGSYYYGRDHLGSITELTDASASVRADYQYDPWGQATKLSGDLSADFGFAGYYSHAPSSLDLAPLRAYDPALARWLSRDPLLPKAGIANKYCYANADPINIVDPLGADTLPIGLDAQSPFAVGWANNYASIDLVAHYEEFYPDPLVGAFGPPGPQLGVGFVLGPLVVANRALEFPIPVANTSIWQLSERAISATANAQSVCQRRAGLLPPVTGSYWFGVLQTGFINVGPTQNQLTFLPVPISAGVSSASGFVVVSP
jgi:RHS repeat-associated protein